MKIGIIGAGNIGGSLARILSASGHDVRIANSRGPEAVRALAEEVGASPVDARGAVDGADLVILSVPMPAVAALPDDLFEHVPDDVPVVDTSNYYPGMRDPQISALDAGEVESVWVAEQLGRPVIKAFNNILAWTLAEGGRRHGDPDRLAVAVAGDDGRAKRTVMDLVDQVGFDPVDGGALAESWRQEPATPGYCCDYDADTLRRCLAEAVRGEAPQKRDKLSQLLMSGQHAPTHAEIIDVNRASHGLV